MALIEVPTRADIGAYTQQIDLDGTVFQLDLHFNERWGRWVMDIQDADRVLLLAGIPLLEGFPLTTKFIGRIPGFPPGEFLVLDESGLGRNPDRETLGGDVKLFYREALAEAA